MDRVQDRYLGSATSDDDILRARLKAWHFNTDRFCYQRRHLLQRREGSISIHRKERLVARKHGGRKPALGTRAQAALDAYGRRSSM
jgi:hypothetical protein